MLDAHVKILINSRLVDAVGAKEAAALRRVLTDTEAENPRFTVEFVD